MSQRSIRGLLVSSVPTTHHGLFFICLVRQYISSVVLGTDHQSRLVLHLFGALVRQYRSTRYGRLIVLVLHLFSAFVRQYCSTRYRQLITACYSFIQYVSTLVLGTENSSRLVLHLFSTLVLQYSVQKTHHGFCSTRYGTTSHGLFFICLVRQYVSTVVLGTDDSSCLFFICLVRSYVSTVVLGIDNSSRLVIHLFSTLVLQYSVQKTHHGLFFICLVRQYVSTVVLGTENSSRLVLHLFSALVRQYCSTRYRKLITACSSFVQYVSTVVLGMDDSSYRLIFLTDYFINQ